VAWLKFDFVFCFFILFFVAGCSTMPASGPTRAALEQGLKDANLNGVDIKLVDISSGGAENEAGDLEMLSRKGFFEDGIGRVNEFAVGDVLKIAVFEIGPSLFSDAALSLGGRVDYGAKAVIFDGLVVDKSGKIYVPYIGEVSVLRKYPSEVRTEMERKLSRLTQFPQVNISILDSPSNKIFVSGGVVKPGIYPLGFTPLRLLDVIALAGGVAGIGSDFVIRFAREGVENNIRLDAVSPTGSKNIVLSPGDRVDLLKIPRTFTALGAANKVSHIAFESQYLSLAEALGKFSGLNDQQADPEAVYVFRGGNGDPASRKIYRLDLLKGESIFLAKDFRVFDKDVIFVANAKSNSVSKFLGLVNQFLSPAVTFKFISQ